MVESSSLHQVPPSSPSWLSYIQDHAPSKKNVMITMVALAGLALMVTALLGYTQVIQGINASTQLSLLAGGAALNTALMVTLALGSVNPKASDYILHEGNIPQDMREEIPDYKKHHIPHGKFKPKKVFVPKNTPRECSIEDGSVKLESLTFTDLNRLSSFYINGQLIYRPNFVGFLRDIFHMNDDPTFSTYLLGQIHQNCFQDTKLTESIEMLLGQHLLLDGMLLMEINRHATSSFDPTIFHINHHSFIKTNLQINPHTFKLVRETIFAVSLLKDPETPIGYYKVKHIISGSNDDLKEATKKFKKDYPNTDHIPTNDYEKLLDDAYAKIKYQVLHTRSYSSLKDAQSSLYKSSSLFSSDRQTSFTTSSKLE